MTDKRLTVGSWSEGSTRDEDILDALTSMARSVGYEDNGGFVFEAEHALDALDDDGHDCGDEECNAADNASDLITTLTDELSEYAPIYCDVGMNEGDGASFGVWLSQDALYNALRYSMPFGDDRINVEDGVIIEVNDHGNVSVYSIERGPGLLSIV